ncbi:hypothetical protein [Gracilibacillus alcaliphilus]|uniref:hypothetical protein n=1 Tax=Gracilibacillus alcaliphilus TaxID=1401441 RepID=UPI00195B3460|nr:hypothetical protein [Gracilibacillus alcaliphilus]MBM7678218.1 hypothetical protein [Gracilibacillus alcaliphilus]
MKKKLKRPIIMFVVMFLLSIFSDLFKGNEISWLENMIFSICFAVVYEYLDSLFFDWSYDKNKSKTSKT